MGRAETRLILVAALVPAAGEHSHVEIYWLQAHQRVALHLFWERLYETSP